MKVDDLLKGIVFLPLTTNPNGKQAQKVKRIWRGKSMAKHFSGEKKEGGRIES